MANQHTARTKAEQDAKVQAILERKTAAELAMATFNRERAAAEKKAREQKKIISDCVNELAALVTNS